MFYLQSQPQEKAKNILKTFDLAKRKRIKIILLTSSNAKIFEKSRSANFRSFKES